MTSPSELKERYASSTNEALLELARKPTDLTDNARSLLAAELRARGLPHHDLAPPESLNETNESASPGALANPPVARSGLPTPQGDPRAIQDSLPMRVEVVDIRMSFWAMVIFMVKWTIASIPAAIVLLLVATVLVTVMGGLAGSVVSQLI